MNSLILTNIIISLQNVRSHILRSILTILIISFGIMALVGILTAIDSIKGSISENFSSMGANSFSISNRKTVIEGMGQHKSYFYKNVSYNEAVSLKNKFEFPAKVSITAYATSVATLKFGNEETNPNISVLGSDENYLHTSGNELEKGRNFSHNELDNGRNVAIIGQEIATQLFNKQSPIDKVIYVGSDKYRVIGLIKSKGASMGFNSDRDCIIPLKKLRTTYYYPNMNFKVNMIVDEPHLLEPAIGEATATFRRIRKLKPDQENNFSITKSDNIAQMFMENMRYVRLVAYIIAFITLLGASVGLMNIMLVTVKERTREIGVRKAMGATNLIIRNQFLTEAIVITELGGIFGIFLGITLGNFVSRFIGGSFIIPWLWIIVALIISFVVGLLSGLIPAMKAAKLNPIDSLRYE